MAKGPSPAKGLSNMLRATMKKTPGGGMADDVPAVIDGQQPAALSEGEYVIPADVVAMLGDGSTEAGARLLDNLVKEIRMKKQGSAKQANPIGELLK